MAASMRGLADELDVPLGVVLEGGYDLEALAESTVATLEVVGAEEPAERPAVTLHPLAAQAAGRLAERWPLVGCRRRASRSGWRPAARVGLAGRGALAGAALVPVPRAGARRCRCGAVPLPVPAAPWAGGRGRGGRGGGGRWARAAPGGRLGGRGRGRRRLRVDRRGGLVVVREGHEGHGQRTRLMFSRLIGNIRRTMTF